MQHIETGCININHDYICACSGLFCNPKDYSGPDPITTIILILDERDPPCRMNFHWPTDFAEVYYGDDRCLRDARHLRPWRLCLLVLPYIIEDFDQSNLVDPEMPWKERTGWARPPQTIGSQRVEMIGSLKGSGLACLSEADFFGARGVEI